MVRIVFCFSLLLILLSTARSQSLADSLREAGQLQQAIETYKTMWLEEPDEWGHPYNIAAAFALLHRADSAFQYLDIALEGDTTVRALNDPDFYFLLDHPQWEGLEDRQIEKVEFKYGKYEKPDLARELWKMKVRDQAFYYHIRQADRSSPIYFALWELKRRLNKENIDRLEDIIDRHGWPKESEVKGSAAQAAFLIVQHSELETQKKYLPMMKEAAEKGEASWSSLALLIDRVRLREGKQQIYGSQIYRREDGSFYVKDLKEPSYVNQRRGKVGLGPIEEYVSRWGIEWNIEQKVIEE